MQVLKRIDNLNITFFSMAKNVKKTFSQVKINGSKRFLSTNPNKNQIVIELPNFNCISNSCRNFMFPKKLAINDKFRKRFNEYYKNILSNLEEDEKEFMTDFKKKFGNDIHGNFYLHKSDANNLLFKSFVKIGTLVTSSILFFPEEMIVASVMLGPIYLLLRFDYLKTAHDFLRPNYNSKYGVLNRIAKKYEDKVKLNLDELD